MDLKLIGTNAEKRIISPSWKLDDYIEKEIDLYFTFILGEDNTNFDRFVIMLVQIFLFRILENKDYPSEDVMIEIINQEKILIMIRINFYRRYLLNISKNQSLFIQTY